MHDIGRLGLLKSYARDVAPVLTREYTDSAEVLAAEGWRLTWITGLQVQTAAEVCPASCRLG